MRWRIEEVFRILKRDGLDIEEQPARDGGPPVQSGRARAVAAARTIQLVDARDGSTRPATDVIAPEEIEAAAAISATLEGATPRQKNPHVKGSLAWLSWIAARLGGWNCYYKPPGPKTMARGLDRLIASDRRLQDRDGPAQMCESRRAEPGGLPLTLVEPEPGESDRGRKLARI